MLYSSTTYSKANQGDDWLRGTVVTRHIILIWVLGWIFGRVNIHVLMLMDLMWLVIQASWGHICVAGAVKGMLL